MKPLCSNRRLGWTAWLACLVLLSTSPVFSQSPGEPPQTTTPPLPQTEPNPPQQPAKDLAPKAFLKDIWGDQKAIWSTPFRMNRRQWLTIALPLAAGTAALIATDEDAAKWLPNTPDQVKWSNRVSNIGTVYTLGGIVAGTILAGKKTRDPQMVDLGRSSAQALVDSIIVNTAIKYMTARERPLENDGQGRFWKGGNSFPSGHAMDTWAVAMVVARHPRSPTWLKVTSCTIATAVSLSRWGARKHFPSDILVGGVFGGLIGNYVATQPRP
jgi:membrane-associated phospholipid phosphatase